MAPTRGWNRDELLDEVAWAHEPRTHRASVRSLANMHRVSCLQEIFPTTAVDMIEDVLVTAKFHVEQAAVLLAELTESNAQLEPGYVDVDVADDEEQWDAVDDFGVETEMETETDEWEVVDHHGNKVRTFADVLRANGSANAPATSLPMLTVVHPRVHTASPHQSIKHSTQPTPVGNEELCVKSFGARKRRFLKKSRR